MKKWGYVYSLIFQGVAVGIVIFILLPYFVEYSAFTATQIIVYFIFFVILKWFIMALKFKLRYTERKRLRYLFGLLIFILLNWCTQFLISFWLESQFVPILFAASSFLIGSLMLYYRPLHRTSRFEHELEIEEDEKMKYIQLIFELSPDIEKISRPVRSKPFLFRKSARIFQNRTAEKAFIELFIKVFLRNNRYSATYFQMISVTAAGILVIPPLWIKGLVLIGFMFMMHIWLSVVWEKIIVSHPLTKKYRDMEEFFIAERKVALCMFVIAIAMTGFFILIGYLLTRNL